jgi:dockerin type I repeat protein
MNPQNIGDGKITKPKTLLRLTAAIILAISSTGFLPVHQAHAAFSSTASSSVSYAPGFDGLSEVDNGIPTAPPDIQVAADYSYVMEMTNSYRAVYNKQGALILKQNLSSFFHTGNDFISDPKIVFDALSGRWFASILDVDSPTFGTRGNVLVAVSAGWNASGSWKVYNTISTGANITPDQPLLGVSSDKVVVSANIFQQNPVTFLGAQWWVFNKSDLEAWAASPGLWSSNRNPTLSSVYPVQSLSASNTEFMVSTNSSETGATSANSVQIFSVTGLPPNVTTSSPVMLSLQTPINRGTAGDEPCAHWTAFGATRICDNWPTIDVGDQRVLTAALYQGKIWLGANEACPPGARHACVRLIQIDTSTSAIRQDIDYGNQNFDLYYPALSIDGFGNLAMVYGFSSKTSTYPSLAITGQMTIDSPGTLNSPRTIRSGTSDDDSGRYGDYFGAAVDPSDTSLVWVAGEYHGSLTGNCLTNGPGTTCWSTFIDKMRLYGPVNLNGDMTLTGIRVRTTGLLNLDPILGSSTFSGTITIVATNSTTGQTLFSKTYTITGTWSQFVVNVQVSPYPLSSNMIITAGAGDTFSAAIGLTRNIDINHDGLINILDLSTVSSHFGCSNGQSCYKPEADLNADGVINNTDLSLEQNYFGRTDYI